MKAIIRPCKNWKFHSCSRSGLYSKFRLWVLVRLRKKSLIPARIHSGTPAPWLPLVDSVTLFKSGLCRMVASVTNASSLTHSTNVLGHSGKLFSSINSSVELLDYWRQSVSFIVPVKSIICEWRTFQVLTVAVCVLIYTF